MTTPSRVLIFGGTHGNEWTGVVVVQKYAEHFRKKYPGLDLHFILSNPEAYKINKRFKDEDLNRAFQFLTEDRPDSYEHKRALEIRDLINQQECFVIDLHTTTSNMGKTVILTDYNSFNLSLCASLTSEFSDCRIIGSPDPHQKYLASQTIHSLMIEMGPTPNGLINPNVLEETLLLLDKILAGLSNPKMLKATEVEIYEEIENVSYPLDHKSHTTGYIHSDFQGKDFIPVYGNYTPFKTFSGEEIQAKTEKEMYPIFINEAAYYPQNLAYTLCLKKLFSV